MFGFVTSVRSIDALFMHTVVTSSNRCILSYKEKFTPGSWIEFSGKEKRIDENTIEIDASSAKLLSNPSAAEMKKVEKHIDNNSKSRTASLMVEDDITLALSKRFDLAASMIKKAVFLHRPIIIRHDDDPDGLCAALALYSVLSDEYNLKVISNPFPYYKMSNAEEDIRYVNSLESEHLSPLLICLDFGSNPESAEGYDFIRKSGFSIIVIDHHPMHDPSMPNRMDLFVSPCAVGSKETIPYTSGFQSAEVAKRIKDVDVDALARVAMTFDRSPLIKPSNKDLKFAQALEFIITTSKYAETIESLYRVIKDEETIDFAYAQSEERVQTLLEKLPSKTKKKTSNGVTFFLVDSGRLWSKGQFPGRAAIANISADHFAMNFKEPAVTLTYGGRGISIRLNQPALKIGLNASLAIKSAKEHLPDLIEAGGGHPVASGMRVKLGSIKQVLDELIKNFGSQIVH